MASCGEFTFENGVLSGPKQYMEERGNAKVEDIMAGRSVVFNQAVMRSPSVEMAVLVTLQTDFAGWKGTKGLLRAAGF